MIELPEGAVERVGIRLAGEVMVFNGGACVELDGHFEAIVDPDPYLRFVHLTPLAAGAPPACAVSCPRDGRFRIVCDAPDGTLVRWEFHGVARKGLTLVDGRWCYIGGRPD